MSGTSAFFYGTLMAPSVLARVTGHDVSHLTIRPAILPDHSRHRVKGVDYPAVIPHSTSSTLPTSDDREGVKNSRSMVRGTYVSGLGVNDFWRLDIFEGHEYERRDVKVRLLKSEGLMDKADETDLEHLEQVDTKTYIWIAPRSDLDDEEWDFEEFKREKMWRWAGGSVEYEDRDSGFDDVERAVREAGEDPTGGRSSVTGVFENNLQQDK